MEKCVRLIKFGIKNLSKMSTYCRITGKSRGLPKSNYYPLLPPISPADAKRLCRITGKSYGLPTHHYIPVLVGFSTNKKKQKNKCPITTKSDGQDKHHYSPEKHTVIRDFKYVFPTLGNSQDLAELLESKNGEIDGNFVYKVSERRCSLVFPGSLESAVRDGEVEDVLLAKDNDTLLLKLRKGGSVEVDVKEISTEGMNLFEGEGPDYEIIRKKITRNNDKKKRISANEWRKKIFEEKERLAAFSEMEENNHDRKKLKSSNGVDERPKVETWQNVQPAALAQFALKNEELKVISNTFNLKNLPMECKGKPLISKLPKPVKIVPEKVDLCVSMPGIVQQPHMSVESVTSLPVASVISPFTPLVANVDPTKLEAAKIINENKDLLSNSIENNVADTNSLLDIKDIARIVNLIKDIDLENVTEFGLAVTLDGIEKFVQGRCVEISDKKVFIPGSVVTTSNGPNFVPGIVVKTETGSKLLPGHVVENGENSSVFIQGQTVLTRDGEKFVQGQFVNKKFTPGQTIYTEDGPKFVAGQIVAENDNLKFVPGETITTQEGPQFVPGQFSDGPNGEMVFTPGQSILDENFAWEFVPGQNLKTKNGYQFVPGQTVGNGIDSHFVPGRFVISNNNVESFVPGIITENTEGLEFVPGLEIASDEGPRFVEGLLAKEGNSVTFVPGKTIAKNSSTENIENEFNFTASGISSNLKSMDDFGISVDSFVTEDFSFDSNVESEIFGHMVQSTEGVQFYPGNEVSGLPAGKTIPGRLVRDKFVPGKIIEGKFVPGQSVICEKGEQFIPGQVIETTNGPKFVPGQLMETSNGTKFVPGQTIQTEDGPKFVPGQIVDTKLGPTFVPGQIIISENEVSKFVPGQVIETAQGPRFVPGRVIETGDRVTFVPGQMVETEEGLKFVAPDLEVDPEGKGYQFTAQGFDVAREELKLLRRQFTPYETSFGEMSVDSTMLQHLSKAGMSIGSEMNLEVPKVHIESIPLTDTALKLSEKLDLDSLNAIKISSILTNIQNMSPKIIKYIMKSPENENLKNILHSCTLNGVSKMENAAKVLEKMILEDSKSPKNEIIDSIYSTVAAFVVNSNGTEIEPDRMSLLRDIVENAGNIEEVPLDELKNILNDEEIAVCAAFQHISKENPEFVGKVLKKVQIMLENEDESKSAGEVLHLAIVNTIKESSELKVKEVINTQGEEFKSLVIDAIGLAKALGLSEAVSLLLGVISDPESIQILANDRIVNDVLRRLTIMRQLAGTRNNLECALSDMKLDPYSARNDPRLRELVRESALLMVVPEEKIDLQSSIDIPSSLLHTDNSLAVEDFMIRSRQIGKTLFILKDGIQAIIPRDASRAVLRGEISYTVLDERGIRYFQPMHVFSALNLPGFFTKHFHTLGNEEYADLNGGAISTRASSVSLDDNPKKYRCCSVRPVHQEVLRHNSVSRIVPYQY